MLSKTGGQMKKNNLKPTASNDLDLTNTSSMSYDQNESTDISLGLSLSLSLSLSWYAYVYMWALHRTDWIELFFHLVSLFSVYLSNSLFLSIYNNFMYQMLCYLLDYEALEKAYNASVTDLAAIRSHHRDTSALPSNLSTNKTNLSGIGESTDVNVLTSQHFMPNGIHLSLSLSLFLSFFLSLFFPL